MPSALKVCYDLYTFWPFHTPGIVGTSFFCTLHAIFQFIGFTYIIYFMWRHKKRAAEGALNEAAASETIIFPFHLWFVWLLAFACLQQTLFDLFIPLADGFVATWAAFLMGYSLALTHAITESVAFLLCFHGVGQHAIRKTVYFFVTYLAIGVGLLGYAWIQPFTSHTRLGISIGWYSAVTVYYAVLWLLPKTYLFRRPALRTYAKFWAIANFALCLSSVFRYFNLNLGYCVYELSTHGLLSVTVPYLIYMTLLDDSRYWLGLSEAAPSGIAEPLLGFQLGPSSARELAQEADAPTYGCGKIVRAINFAFLSLEKNLDSTTSSKYRHVVLGAGSTSRVFRGRYKQTPVAIKMIFCFDLTPEVVSNFYREASFLARLGHPNIVRVEGVSVNPPAICLVLELCATNVMDLLESAYRGLPLDEHSLLTGGIEAYDANNRPILVSESSSTNSGATDNAEGKPTSPQQTTSAGSSVGMSMSSSMTGSGVGASSIVDTLSPFPASATTITPSPSSSTTATQAKGLPYYAGQPIRYRVGGGLNWVTKLRMMMDCCRAVEYLHTQNPPVLHLDIKSSNFLVGSDGLLKLADLELSRQVYTAPASELSKQAQRVSILAGGSGRRRSKKRSRRTKNLRSASSSGKDIMDISSEGISSPNRTAMSVFSDSSEQKDEESLDWGHDDEEDDYTDDDEDYSDGEDYAIAEDIPETTSAVVSSDGVQEQSGTHSSLNSSVISPVSSFSSTAGSNFSTRKRTPSTPSSLSRRNSRSSSTTTSSGSGVSFAAAAAAATPSSGYIAPIFTPLVGSSTTPAAQQTDVVISVDDAPKSGHSARLSVDSSQGSGSVEDSTGSSQLGSFPAMPAIRSPLMGIRLPERINWLAPEIILGQEYDEKADVYSLTCVLWEILTGHVPYTDLEDKVKEYLSLPQLPNAKPQSLLAGYSADRQAAADGTFLFNSPTGLNTYINTTTATPVAGVSASPFLNGSPGNAGVRFSVSALQPPALHEEDEAAPIEGGSSVACALHDATGNAKLIDTDEEGQEQRENCTCDGDKKSRNADGCSESGQSLPEIPPPVSGPNSVSGSLPGIAASVSTSAEDAPNAAEENDENPLAATTHTETLTTVIKSTSTTRVSSKKTSYGGGLIKSSSYDGTDAAPSLGPLTPQSVAGRVKIAEEPVRVVAPQSQPNAESGLLNLNRKPVQGILRNSAKYHTAVSTSRVSFDGDDDTNANTSLSLQARAEEARKKHLQKLRAASAPPSQQQVFAAMRHMICIQHYRPTIPSNTPPVLRRLLQQGWAPNPRDRPSCTEMLTVLARLDSRLQASLFGQPSLSAVGRNATLGSPVRSRSDSPFLSTDALHSTSMDSPSTSLASPVPVDVVDRR